MAFPLGNDGERKIVVTLKSIFAWQNTGTTVS